MAADNTDEDRPGIVRAAMAQHVIDRRRMVIGPAEAFAAEFGHNAAGLS
jgi:hypothetical protein